MVRRLALAFLFLMAAALSAHAAGKDSVVIALRLEPPLHQHNARRGQRCRPVDPRGRMHDDHPADSDDRPVGIQPVGSIHP